MDKKDIYEHLANIYLDASSKRKKKKKLYPKFFKNAYVIAIALIACVIVFLSVNFPKNSPFHSEVALVLLPDAAKINFNFDPAKKEIYSLNLNKLNLTTFEAIGFSIKKKNYKDVISLRVEFVSSFKEKSEVYLANIPYKWKDYKISFSDFKHIADWSKIAYLSFSVEEWNTREKEGVVYIDNVRLLR